MTADGQPSVRFRGYEVHADGEHARAAGDAVPGVRHDGGTLSVSMQHFWQNFPKSIAADASGIVLGLFPPAPPHTRSREASKRPMSSTSRSPRIQSRRFRSTGAARPAFGRTALVLLLEGHQIPGSGRRRSEPRYLELVQSAIEGPHSFEEKRHVIDEYRLAALRRHLWRSRSRAQPPGAPPLVSHYNNQYDAIAGFGHPVPADRRLALVVDSWTIWPRMSSTSTSTTRRTTRPRTTTACSGTPTTTWTPATRRIGRIPNADGVVGGGPSADHNYTTGLMLHYFLTGDRLDPRMRSIGLARWVDRDGRRTRRALGWLSRGPTGLVSRVGGDRTIMAPGARRGNSVNALLDGHV